MVDPSLAEHPDGPVPAGQNEAFMASRGKSNRMTAQPLAHDGDVALGIDHAKPSTSTNEGDAPVRVDDERRTRLGFSTSASAS